MHQHINIQTVVSKWVIAIRNEKMIGSQLVLNATPYTFHQPKTTSFIG